MQINWLKNPPTAEELIAKGIAPIKRPWIKKFQEKVHVEAVTGRRGEQAAAKEGKAVQQKSRNQKRKERTNQAQSELCGNFTAGKCTFGTKCRFNHDIEGYIRSKAEDLPGVCPFTSLDRCPYGIACRWASTHKNELPLVQAAMEAVKKQQQQEQEVIPQGANADASAAKDANGTDSTLAGTGTGGPALHTGADKDGSTADKDGSTADKDGTAAVEGNGTAVNGTAMQIDLVADSADGNGVKNDTAAEAAMITGVQNVPAAVQLSADSAGVKPATDGSAAKKKSGDGTVPEGTIVLPVPAKIEKAINHLSKEVQNQLWKNKYDFGVADAVLGELGVKVSHRRKQAPQKQGKQSSAQAKRQGKDTAQKGATDVEHKEDAVNEGNVTSTSEPAVANDFKDVAHVNGVHVASTSEHTGANYVGNDVENVVGVSVVSTSAPAATNDVKDVKKGSGTSVSNDGAPSSVPGVTDADGAANGQRDAVDGAQAAETDAQVEGSKPSTLEGHHEETDSPEGRISKKPRVDESASKDTGAHVAGPAADSAGDAWRDMDVDVPLRSKEKKTIDFRGKLYLAPLTTVGNLPFRRICKGLGADVTCGEMALATNLLQGQMSEWALLKKHQSEDCFGVQICGGFPDAMARAAQLLEEQVQVDFVDVNCGCPIDLICSKAAGSSLLLKRDSMESITRSMSSVLSCPLTLKIRKGYHDNENVAHTIAPLVRSWGAQALTLHGRSRQQRYTKSADWNYVLETAHTCPDVQMIGNGDILSYTEYQEHMSSGALTTCMIARGALIKPWIFTEIKEQRHWDISAMERLDMLKDFCSYGLEHWGSDHRGVENTRRFLLEWMSFQCRYVPVGLLEVLPQRMQLRPPPFYGRNDLETLLGSDNAADWVKLSEMLLGPAPSNFVFAPKHKSNAYQTSEADMAKMDEWGEAQG